VHQKREIFAEKRLAGKFIIKKKEIKKGSRDRNTHRNAQEGRENRGGGGIRAQDPSQTREKGVPGEGHGGPPLCYHFGTIFCGRKGSGGGRKTIRGTATY